MAPTRDFTHRKYRALLIALKGRNYVFFPFNVFIKSNTNTPVQLICILRHDVDRLPGNSLTTARIENELGIKCSYYFRVVKDIYNLRIMNRIEELGHEIGYHYEDVDLVSKKIKVKRENDKEELIHLAYESFCKNLEMFRNNFNVKTICMHGSPRSKYDNRIIWEKYNYKDLGIIGEPYFDVDFNEFAYFTDTGRRWDGVAIRDKVKSSFQDQRLKDNEKSQFKKTQEIIDNIDKLPEKIMFTIHSQRWNDSFFPWAKELVCQNVKNVVKRFLVKDKSKKMKVGF